jgi:hypothetical protein
MTRDKAERLLPSLLCKEGDWEKALEAARSYGVTKTKTFDENFYTYFATRYYTTPFSPSSFFSSFATALNLVQPNDLDHDWLTSDIVPAHCGVMLFGAALYICRLRRLSISEVDLVLSNAITYRKVKGVNVWMRNSYWVMRRIFEYNENEDQLKSYKMKMDEAGWSDIEKV